MRKVFILFLILPGLAAAQIPFSDTVMPFGAYSYKSGNHSYFTNARLDTMHNIMGFNQHFSNGFPDTTAGRWVRHGIYPYPGNTVENWDDDWDPQRVYAESHYFVCQPESSDYYNITFDIDGWTEESTYVYSDAATLSGLSLYHPNRYFKLDDGDQIRYFPSFKIKIDTTGATGDTVGIFKVYRHWIDGHGDTTHLFIDTVLISELTNPSIFNDFVELEFGNESDSMSDTTSFADSSFFYMRSQFNTTRAGGYIWYIYETRCNITSYIDCFVVHCQNGEDVVGGIFAEPDSDKTADIIQSISRTAFKDSIAGWYLTEPRESNFRPFGYIDSLIRNESGWGESSVYGLAWIPFGSIYYYKDFMRISPPELFLMYSYPIDIHTNYTETAEHGLQSDINYYLVRACDSVRFYLEEYSSETRAWMYTPQYWYCDSVNDGCNWREQRRKLTTAEIQCLTYVGMCYQPKSILFYLLDSGPTRAKGILDVNNNLNDLGITVRDDINPYIKAIDSVYLGLTWDTSYAVNPETSFPSSDLIDTIYAEVYTGYGRDVHPPPDNGWFHVGEFHDDSCKYFMLVNRSCSWGPDDPSEAPSVTAFIRLKPEAVGSDYAYIIDVVDTAYYDSTSSIWKGVPDTTYSAKLDGTIPFTTVLKAGEGRLFKIVGTEEKALTTNSHSLPSK